MYLQVRICAPDQNHFGFVIFSLSLVWLCFVFVLYLNLLLFLFHLTWSKINSHWPINVHFNQIPIKNSSIGLFRLMFLFFPAAAHFPLTQMHRIINSKSRLNSIQNCFISSMHHTPSISSPSSSSFLLLSFCFRTNVCVVICFEQVGKNIWLDFRFCVFVIKFHRYFQIHM